MRGGSFPRVLLLQHGRAAHWAPHQDKGCSCGSFLGQDVRVLRETPRVRSLQSKQPGLQSRGPVISAQGDSGTHFLTQENINHTILLLLGTCTAAPSIIPSWHRSHLCLLQPWWSAECLICPGKLPCATLTLMVTGNGLKQDATGQRQRHFSPNQVQIPAAEPREVDWALLHPTLALSGLHLV